MTNIAEVPVTPITHLYIDDLRDPVRYLGEDRGSKMTWAKTWREANRILKLHEASLEEIHFDHYLDTRDHTGGDLFQMVMFRLGRLGGKYANLKRCYLHSSDSCIVDELIEAWREKAAEHGVELIANSNRH